MTPSKAEKPLTEEPGVPDQAAPMAALSDRPAALITRLAQDDTDLKAAQRLRYLVFVEELGAGGAMVDHDQRLESDALDAEFDHLLLVDPTIDPASLAHVVGVYRLLPGERAARIGRFYSDDEYDLAPLKASGRRLVELGRSCVHPAHRGGAAMLQLWSALADYVLTREIEILFGVASFHGTDPAAHAAALSWLHHHHLAPEALRVRARPEGYLAMDILPEAELSRSAALAAIPPLIRGYLRLGGQIGEGAYIDKAFNTIDVCLIIDTAAMSARHREFYVRKSPRPD